MASNGHANGNNEGGAVGRENINTDIVTLTRFLTEEQRKHPEATGDFTLDLSLPQLPSSLLYCMFDVFLCRHA